MANSSKYPNSIDTTNELPLATNNVTPVIAEQVNRLRNAIVNIETELGVNPSGTYSTVRDRLDAQNGTVGNGAVQIQNDGAVVVNEATIIDFIGNVTVTNPSSLKARIEVTGGQATQVQETKTVSTNGQTSFTLTSTPVDSTSVLMFVNGLKQTYSSDFLVSGTSVSYVGSTSLTTADIVEFYYLVDLGGISGGGGSTTITLKEDAATVSSSVTTINFTGNTNLTNNGGGQITVDVPTVTPTITLKEEGTNVNTATTTVNFTGNVNLTNNGSGQVTVDIPSGGGSIAQMRVYIGTNITMSSGVYQTIEWNGGASTSNITTTNCSLITSNTQIQVNISGVYLIQGQLSFSTEFNPSPRGLGITVLHNGVDQLLNIGAASRIISESGAGIDIPFSFITELNATDTVEVAVSVSPGSDILISADETISWFSVKLLN